MEHNIMAYSLRIFRAVAVAAFLAPIAVAAQQPVSTDPLTNPTQHLADAGQRLDSIPKNVPADAQQPLADLRKHFAELDKAYRSHAIEIGQPILADDIAAPAAQADPAKQATPVAWQEVFSVVERDLALLIGGGASAVAISPVPPSAAPAAPPKPAANTLDPTAAPPETPEATATPSGTPPGVAPGVAEDVTALTDVVGSEKVNELGLKDLDAATRAGLDQFRMQLELFYASTMGDRSLVQTSTK
jgi:hypothetical protein